MVLPFNVSDIVINVTAQPIWRQYKRRKQYNGEACSVIWRGVGVRRGERRHAALAEATGPLYVSDVWLK